MPKLTSEVSHQLGQKIAIERLKKSCEWAHSISDVKEIWSGNVMNFIASIQGIKISGYIEVTEDSLNFSGNIPLIALPFKSWIHNILQNSLKERKPVNETIKHGMEEPLLFYLHIPKAGGTTLGEFIYNHCRTNEDNDEGLIKNGVFFTADGFFREEKFSLSPQMQNLLQRNDLRAVMGHFAFGLHNFVERPYQYVTILREPVSRVISLYHYLNLEDKMSLEDFANSCPYCEIDNDQTRRIAGVHPEIGRCSEKDLALAKENLRQHFAVAGITERFDETLVLLKQKFHWTKKIPSYARNINTDKKESSSISPTTMQAIQNRNLLDIELHRYAYQMMDEMIAKTGDTFIDLLNQQKEANTL